MDITKRNGSVAPFDREKIATAIKKSFISTGRPIVEDEIHNVAIAVEQVIITHPAKQNVECIQDEVERSLMQRGFYAEAKSYILFRWQRTEQRKYLNRIANTLQQTEIAPVLKGIAADFEPELYPIAALAEKFMGFVKADMNGRDKLSALIKAAVELTSAEAPNWEFIAARLLSYRLQRDLETFEQAEDIQSFAQKVRHLASQNLYGAYIVDAYTESELQQAASFIDEERNKLLNYSGLDLLIKRYVIRSFAHKPVESVQEMFLGIALHLAMNEGENRLHWVKKFYDMLSRLEVTMATPTLANARKPFHQLSSCFIDTVPDSLEGIYRSIDNFAQVSKFGGGMGLYFGKVRAAGGRIRGFKGAAGGVVRWMKLVNDTAVAVDQLGVRQGAVAISTITHQQRRRPYESARHIPRRVLPRPVLANGATRPQSGLAHVLPQRSSNYARLLAGRLLRRGMGGEIPRMRGRQTPFAPNHDHQRRYPSCSPFGRRDRNALHIQPRHR